MTGGQPNYYVYKGVRHLDCPKNTKIIKYEKDVENGGYYAVVRRTSKRFSACCIAIMCIMCILCSAWVLWRMKDNEGAEVGMYILYSPIQAVSFDRNYIYIGLQADAKNPAGVWICLLQEDGECIMNGLVLNPGEFLGIVDLCLPLQLGAANYVLEVWDQGKVNKLGQKIITLIYMGE